jgi:hypothetical protein
VFSIMAQSKDMSVLYCADGDLLSKVPYHLFLITFKKTENGVLGLHLTVRGRIRRLNRLGFLSSSG